MEEKQILTTTKGTEDAIAAIEFHIKRKMKNIHAIEKKAELSENEKVKIGAERDFISSVRKLIEVFRNNMRANLGMLPPSDESLEKAVLGAVILEANPKSVLNFLKPEHFYFQTHAEIYTAVLSLHTQGAPIDMRTVVNELRRTGKIEQVGGAYYIAELTARVSSAANTEYHARILIEFAIRRQMIMMGSEMVTEAYDDTMDAFELLDRADALVNEAKQWRKK